MKKITAFIIAVVIALFAFAGCTQKNNNTVRLNEVTHSVFYAPLYVAIENGYFEEEGITIELTNGGGAQNSMTAILSNQADIGLMGPEAAINVYNGGKKDYPLVFAQLTNCDGSFIVAKKKIDDFDASKMLGKTIIGGRKAGVPAMSLEYGMKELGLLSPDNYTLNLNIAFNNIVPAFLGSDDYDYCTVFEPTASMLEKDKKAYVVAPVSEFSGKMPFTAFMASQKYLRNNKKQVENFTKALIKGINFVKNNDAKTIANAVKNQFSSTDFNILISSIARYKEIGAYATTPIMSKENFDNLQEVMLSSKQMKYSKVDFSIIVDNSIAYNLLNS